MPLIVSIQSPEGNQAEQVETAAFYVQVKSLWADEWQTVNYLEPVSATATVAPNISKASFLYRYGDIKREDSQVFQQFDPLSVNNKYVRIMGIDGGVVSALWVGIITEESFSPHGTADPQGDQQLTAYGLEHLLDRCSIFGAFTESGFIDSCPTFNGRENYGGGLIGNSTGTGRGVLFGNEGNTWSNREIILYLLENYCVLPIELSGQFGDLIHLYGVHNLEGLTIRQALDKLIDRRRGMGWFIETDGTGTISLHVFSVYTGSFIISRKVFTGNLNLVNLELAGKIDVESVNVNRVQSAAYDKIVVQGCRAKACFSVAVASGGLQKGWNGVEEEEYQAAGPGQQAAGHLDHVYQKFVIPDSWDWRGDGGANVMPAGSNHWSSKRPLLRWVPIETPGDENEYQQPMVFVQAETEGTQFYSLVDKLSNAGKPGAHVSTLDGSAGVLIKSEANHIFGLNHFEVTSENEIAPTYDYSTLLATVAIDTDHRISETISTGNGGCEIPRTLVLDVHDAEHWYIVAGTVTGVNNGGLVRAGSKVVVRDDTDKIKSIARLARSWYSSQRAEISIQLKSVSFLANLGHIIETIDGESVNTVVTSKKWDFRNRSTAVTTGYGSLDIRAMLDIPGVADLREAGRVLKRQEKEIEDLKARVGGLPSRLSAGGSSGVGSESESEGNYPTVDFIVDNFDRADSDDLGSCYSGKGHGVRGNTATQLMADLYTISGQLLCSDLYLIGAASGVSQRHLGHIAIAGRGTVADPELPASSTMRYQALLSNADYVARIRVRYDTSAGIDTMHCAPMSLFFRASEYLTTKIVVDLLLYQGDVYWSNSSISVDPFNGFFALARSENTYMPLESIVGVTCSSGWEYVSTARSKCYPGIVDQSSPGTYYGYSSESYGLLLATKYLRTPSRPTTGYHDFVVTHTGDNLEIYFNGNLLTTETTLGAVDAGFFGLVANNNQLTKQELPRIESIKVWAADKPEPPDNQSGHGTHDGTNFNYTDKYHTTNPDTGTVRYNPNA